MATAAPPPPPPNVSACAAKTLKIRAIHETSNSALLVLTNEGKHSCSMSGWPTVALMFGGTRAALSTVNVTAPSAPVGLTLKPGRSAFAGLRWKPCATGQPGCHLGNALLVGGPGAQPVLVRPIGFPGNQLTMSLLEIGAIQPTTTNIVNW